MATAPPKLYLVAQKFIKELDPMSSVDGGRSNWNCQNEWATPRYTDIDMWDNWMIEMVHHHLKSLSTTRRQQLIEESRDMPITPGIMLIKGYNESIGTMQDAILASLITDMIYKILYPDRDAVSEMQLALAAPIRGRF